MKPRRLLPLGIILLIMSLAWYFLPTRLRIISGYAAKSACSCVFVAQRPLESARLRDLDFSFIKYANVWVDREERAAYASVLGMARRKAVFRDGLGCRLVSDGGVSARESYTLPEPAVRAARPWPAGDLAADTSFSEVHYERLLQTVGSFFDREGEKRFNTHALLVVYKDQILAEQYAPDFGPETPQLGWSMTKTMTGAMIGLLVDQGKLELDQPAPIPAWQQDERRRITLRQLLQMESGLAWNEAYGGMSDATRMLYLQADKAAYAIDKPLDHEPGSQWVYSSGTTNILQYIIRQQFDSDEAYWRFPYEQLLYPAGMYHTTLETDASGLFVGSSYAYASPRDWARFGLLYLHGGAFDGRRVLSEDWIAFSTRPTATSQNNYAAQLWHNRGGEYPSAPPDMFYFRGFHGQRVFVIPSRDLVIVRLGVSEEDTFDFDALLAGVLNTVGAI